MPEPAIRSDRLTEAAFSFITGRPGASPTGQGGLRGMLMAAFGPSRRNPDRPDLTAAAATLNVSPRQLRRWVSGEAKRPRPEAVSQLTKMARQAATTKRGRRAAMNRARQTRTAAPPANRNALRVSGTQGVLSSNDDQYRDRDTVVNLNAAELAAMQQAWTERGNAGLVDFLHDHWDTNYTSGWHFLEIDEISWDRR